MPEFLGWTVLAGLAVTILGIFLLSSRIERHTRSMLAILMHNNEMILAQLDDHRAGASAPAASPVGFVIERRDAGRGDLPAGDHEMTGEDKQYAMHDRRMGMGNASWPLGA